MFDEDIDKLKTLFDQGLEVYDRSEWPTLRKVTGFGVADDEPVAFYGDGTYSALWASCREMWLVGTLSVPDWPATTESA